MSRIDTYIQKEAYDMFGAREEIIESFRETSVEDIYKNPDYYEEIMELSRFYLNKCYKFIDENVLCEEELKKFQENFPDSDNLAYNLGYYTYRRRNWIYKCEIQEFIDILSVKMDEYKKYSMEITVNAGVALALLCRNYPAS